VHTLREILDAIFYIVRSGCAWRLLPHDFPPWKTVHHYFRTWRIDGTWQRMHSALRKRVRVRQKKNPQPSAAIVDSQSIKTTGVGGKERGYEEARRSRGASATSWWTRRVWCSKRGFIARKSKIGRASSSCWRSTRVSVCPSASLTYGWTPDIQEKTKAPAGCEGPWD